MLTVTPAYFSSDPPYERCSLTPPERRISVLVHKMFTSSIRGGKLAAMPSAGAGDPDEISAARLDRELAELLQELRVEQNGILLLVGFLLVVPFSTRFNHVSSFERDVYYLTLLSAGLAALVIIAPVAHHRLVFRKHEKAGLVRRGHQFASAGLMLLATTLLGVLVLVTNFLFGTALTICTSVAYFLAVATLWLAVPMETWHHPPPEPKSSESLPASTVAADAADLTSKTGVR
jgi:hypothetical protein